MHPNNTEHPARPQVKSGDPHHPFLLPDQCKLERRCILLFRRLALIHRKDYALYKTQCLATADRAYAEHFRDLKKPKPVDLVTREQFFKLLDVWIQNGWQHPARYFSSACRKGQQKATEAKREQSAPARARALQLRQSGLSYRKIAEQLKAEGFAKANGEPFAYCAVGYWIKESEGHRRSKQPTYTSRVVYFGLCITTRANKKIIVASTPQAEIVEPTATPDPSEVNTRSSLCDMLRAGVVMGCGPESTFKPSENPSEVNTPTPDRPDHAEDSAAPPRLDRGRPLESATQAPDETRDLAAKTDSSEGPEEQLSLFDSFTGYGYD